MITRKSGWELSAQKAKFDKLAVIEAHLTEKYLGDDFNEIVLAAEKPSESVFIAGAGFNLEGRTRIFKEWRARQALKMIEDHDYGPAFLDEIEPDLAAEIRAGEIGIDELARRLDEAFESKISDLRSRSKGARLRLDDGCRKAIEPAAGHAGVDPVCGVILESGECKLFHKITLAKEWGESAKVRFKIFEVRTCTVYRGNSPD